MNERRRHERTRHPWTGSTGLANPSFTIAALAERCMDRIVPGLRDGAGRSGDSA
jgi:hypothetical protein